MARLRNTISLMFLVIVTVENAFSLPYNRESHEGSSENRITVPMLLEKALDLARSNEYLDNIYRNDDEEERLRIQTRRLLEILNRVLEKRREKDKEESLYNNKINNNDESSFSNNYKSSSTNTNVITRTNEPLTRSNSPTQDVAGRTKITSDEETSRSDLKRLLRALIGIKLGDGNMHLSKKWFDKCAGGGVC